MPLPPLTRRPRTFEAVSKLPIIPEADVVAKIKKFLEDKGWYHERMMYVNAEIEGRKGQRLVVGKRGMEDDRYTYFLGKTRTGLACIILVEAKRQGAKMLCRCAERERASIKSKCTACNQAKYRKDMEALGALFGPGDSIDKFMAWYEEAFAWLHDGTVAGQITLF